MLLIQATCINSRNKPQKHFLYLYASGKLLTRSSIKKNKPLRS
ncbi:hypothetical protein NEOC65_000766 [Neochlamydia sp. AcF65]|nr:hypothetical protein [Neochlamydia sp. AcF65]MBS4170069.1 hypothetical protein [Neochlamydia sp. AcF95]